MHDPPSQTVYIRISHALAFSFGLLAGEGLGKAANEATKEYIGFVDTDDAKEDSIQVVKEISNEIRFIRHFPQKLYRANTERQPLLESVIVANLGEAFRDEVRFVAS